MTINIGGIEKDFIVDTGSPVTIISPDKAIIKNKRTLPITRQYQDVKKKEKKFIGTITVEAENIRIITNLTTLIT